MILLDTNHVSILLSSLFEFFATFLIAPFDQAAADLFDSLQAAMV